MDHRIRASGGTGSGNAYCQWYGIRESVFLVTEFGDRGQRCVFPVVRNHGIRVSRGTESEDPWSGGTESENPYFRLCEIKEFVFPVVRHQGTRISGDAESGKRCASVNPYFRCYGSRESVFPVVRNRRIRVSGGTESGNP